MTICTNAWRQKGLPGLRNKCVHETGYWLKVEGCISVGLRNVFEIFEGFESQLEKPGIYAVNNKLLSCLM